jgi:hypothetical protein
MPRKKRVAADLFGRSEAEWVRIQGHERGALGLAAIPALGIGLLIRYGELTAGESAMIRAVHAGEATHEHLDAPHRVAHYMVLMREFRERDRESD